MYRGKGFVEVRQFGVSKATVVALILGYLKDKVGVPDFAFFAGDDGSDELAFKGKEEDVVSVASCRLSCANTPGLN